MLWLWAVKRLDDMHGDELQKMNNDPHGAEEKEDAAKADGEGGEGAPATVAAA